MNLPSHAAALKPTAFSLRLLFPFHLPEGLSSTAREALLAYAPHSQDSPVWQPADPHPIYSAELLRQSAAFLFPSSPAPAYFTLRPETRQRWFRATTAVVLNGQLEATWRNRKPAPVGPRPESAAISLDTDSGIELFLFHDRLGLLSFSFCSPLRSTPGGPPTLSALKDAFYHLSHTKYRVPVFRIPHPLTDPAWAPPHEQPFPQELTLDDPLHRRLGFPGQPFSLAELRDLLLAPLAGIQFLPEQNQFLAHSTVRFPLDVDFASPQFRDALCPELASFAQLEESDHPLPPPDRLGIPSDLLSAKHAAAYSFLGAAHFVADQFPPGQSENSFDAARVRQIQQKYFLAYALTLTQRLLTHRFLDDAIRLRRTPAQFASLWDLFTAFEAAAQLTDVSRREAVNRCYRLSQAAQRIPDTLLHLHRIFRDVQASEAASAQRRLLLQQEETRHRLGLIEVFIVVVYTAELTHILGEIPHFNPYYLFAGVLGFSFLALVIVLLHHRSAAHLPASSPHPHPRRLLFLLAATVLFFLLWLAGGFLTRSQPSPPPAPPPASPQT